MRVFFKCSGSFSVRTLRGLGFRVLESFMLWVSLESFDGELQTKHVGNPKPHGFRVWGFSRFRFQGACL